MPKSNTIKTIATSLGIVCILFFSLKFEKLDEYKVPSSMKLFDAPAYAQKFWDEVLPQKKKNAAATSEVFDLLETNPQEAFSKYSKVLGISTSHYFLLKGEGIIEELGEEFMTVKIDPERSVNIATDFIFGNAIRDGSGGVLISDFINMTDFNNVSIAINKIVKEKVIPPIRSIATPGSKIKYIGATEISENNINFESILIIPVDLSLIKTKNE